MARPELLEDEGVQGLCATVLRNLACVSPGPGLPGAPPDTTPALAVTAAGAAAALEGAMERFPSSVAIQVGQTLAFCLRLLTF